MQGAAISAARARVACHSHALARPWVPRVSRWKPAPPRAPARQHCRQLRGAPLARAWRDRERDVDLDWQNVRMDGDERLENVSRRPRGCPARDVDVRVAFAENGPVTERPWPCRQVLDTVRNRELARRG